MLVNMLTYMLACPFENIAQAGRARFADIYQQSMKQSCAILDKHVRAIENIAMGEQPKVAMLPRLLAASQELLLFIWLLFSDLSSETVIFCFQQSVMLHSSAWYLLFWKQLISTIQNCKEARSSWTAIGSCSRSAFHNSGSMGRLFMNKNMLTQIQAIL